MGKLSSYPVARRSGKCSGLSLYECEYEDFTKSWVIALFAAVISLVMFSGCQKTVSPSGVQGEVTHLDEAGASAPKSGQTSSVVLEHAAQSTSSNAVLADKPEVLSKATQVNAVKQLDNSLVVVTDSQSGQHAVVGSDGRTLSLQDKSGNTIWSKDIVAEIGDAPLYYRGRIEDMYVYGDALILLAGNGFYYIDKTNGKITRSGAR